MRVPTKLLGILAVIIIMATATGCDSGNGSNHQTLTENDFADNPSLRADPDNQIIVDFEESPSSDTPQYDTGKVGIDDIPLTYPYTETVTFCWTDDNTADMDYMVLLDSQGEQVLRVDVNGDCVTDTIEPGDYVMELHHDDSTDQHTIFMGPQGGPDQQAMKTDRLFNGFKVVVAKILKGISNTISHVASAQADRARIPEDYVLRTNRCSYCYLFGANFRDQVLTYAEIDNSDLRQSVLRGTRLIYADLVNDNFGDANLREANFNYSDLAGAHLPNAAANYARTNCPSFKGARWCNDKCNCIYLQDVQPSIFKYPSLCTCEFCGTIRPDCRHPNAGCGHSTGQRACDGP